MTGRGRHEQDEARDGRGTEGRRRGCRSAGPLTSLRGESGGEGERSPDHGASHRDTWRGKAGDSLDDDTKKHVLPRDDDSLSFENDPRQSGRVTFWLRDGPLTHTSLIGQHLPLGGKTEVNY